MTTTTAPICPSCRVRECEYDGDPESRPGYYSFCTTCSLLRSAAPWCPCRVIQGHHTATKTAPVVDASGELLGYRCPDCHKQATQIGWARANGRYNARVDITQHEEWLFVTRLTHQRKALANGLRNAEHPIASHRTHPATIAYAQAYITEAEAH